MDTSFKMSYCIYILKKERNYTLCVRPKINRSGYIVPCPISARQYSLCQSTLPFFSLQGEISYFFSMRCPAYSIFSQRPRELGSKNTTTATTTLGTGLFKDYRCRLPCNRRCCSSLDKHPYIAPRMA